LANKLVDGFELVVVPNGVVWEGEGKGTFG